MVIHLAAAGRRNRMQPGKSGQVFLRQPDDGHPADGVGRRHGVAKFVALGPSARIRNSRRFRSKKRIYGTVIPKKPTRPTVSPRK